MDDRSHLFEPLIELATESGRIAIQERNHLRREIKPDGSIVTSADREVESFLRVELPKLVGSSNVWGEEFGFESENLGGVWAVDPIDGTSNYAYGSPLWGISIALIAGSEIVLGCVALPDLGETYIAALGAGSFLNGSPISKIPFGPVLDQELVSFNDNVVRSLGGRRVPGKRRDLGSFVVSGAFVATQRFRGLIGRREKLYDCAASILLCTELGAEVRYVDGDRFEIAPLIADVLIERPWMIFPMDSGFVDSMTTS